MGRHPERVPPWNQLLVAAGDRPQPFTSSDMLGVGRVSAAFRGTPIEEIPPSASHELITWPMYRTFIGDGSPEPRFWRQLYWLFRQEEQIATERALAADGWEFKRFGDD